ncbi:hypothetical protein MKK55_18650 [Methylobacterium sp. J-059]|uniref:hypothetical protein n=1 Tax=Methylobacterium sp. J-059 TaxID=2836643 RepID=UPI001FB9AE0C|nr:hypothetical protein [Methylobacterium sp. J-059]MCJ2040951.1 hypothetical protein [Methylobacterium sp. J-059]
MRTALIAMALLGAAPAVAAERFPTASDVWHYEGRAPDAGGEARFLRLDATPDGRGGWVTVVVCGRVSLRTGHEVITYTGRGSAARSRGGWLGGTTTLPGMPTTGWLIAQTGDGLLDQAVQTAAPGEDRVCPNARGDLSSGD